MKTPPSWADAHHELHSKCMILETIMKRIGYPVVAYSIARTKEEQAEIVATGVIAARPGKSKHELRPAKAADYMFIDSRHGPFGSANPWGVFQMVAKEICGLQVLGNWDKTTKKFTGDLGHVQIS